jgi:imidazolonepropionase-like amidohydrolase
MKRAPFTADSVGDFSGPKYNGGLQHNTGMKRSLSRGTFFSLALTLLWVVTAAAETPIVFIHVNVIDTNGGPTRRDMTVVISGSRISDVASSGGARVPKNARIVDGRNKYLISGLWDMHVHTVFGDWLPRWTGERISLPLFVANGVTGVRDMGGDLPVLKQWRADLASGKMLGPQMVIAGPMLDGPTPRFPSSAPVSSPAEGRKTVDDLKAAGVDFVKIQSLIPRDAYFAVAEEAKHIGITFVGHVPDAVRATEASNAGQKSIEHFTGVFEGCSRVEEELMKGPKGPGRFVETYDEDRAKSLVALFAKNETWQVPTLVWEHGQWLIDESDFSHDPLTKYAPAVWERNTWPMFTKDILTTTATDPLAQRKRFTQMELEMTNRMHRAGVPFMAGTDTAAGVHVFPGFSLHEELAYFVQAGMTPMEALQAATRNPARFLGRVSEMGTVEKGKVADLVLLDADPLADIHNTTKIQAVILRGRLFTRAELDEMLRQVQTAAAAGAK